MKKIYWLLLGILFLITLIIDFVYLRDYDSHWWNSIPAFYALYGLVSTVTIIYAGKIIGKNIVNREIDYYD